MTTLVLTLQKVISAYNGLLIILGTIGNILACHICLKKSLRQVSTFKLYAFIIMIDTISLYHWNLNNFIDIFFKLSLENTYLWYCYFASYFQVTTFEISGWILVKLNLLSDINFILCC